jgi:hypothetical protein
MVLRELSLLKDLNSKEWGHYAIKDSNLRPGNGFNLCESKKQESTSHRIGWLKLNWNQENDFSSKPSYNGHHPTLHFSGMVFRDSPHFRYGVFWTNCYAPQYMSNNYDKYTSYIAQSTAKLTNLNPLAFHFNVHFIVAPDKNPDAFKFYPKFGIIDTKNNANGM